MVSNQLIYRNARYGFTLRIPAWWKNYCVVSRKKRDRETEYELHFRFKYKGKIYDDIFALHVYRMTRKQWIERGYNDSPIAFIAEYEGRVFARLSPGELPEAFYDEKTGDYNYKKYGTPIELLKRMVNRDTPRIARSLKFVRRSVSMKSTPYRVSKVTVSKRRTRR